jgi:hypothetical protein
MNEELSEDQKQKIEAEEAYRWRINRQIDRNANNQNGSGCFGSFLKFILVIAGLGVLAVAVLSSVNPQKQMEKARTLRESQEIGNVLPVTELMKKTESQIRIDYGDFISDYSDTGLTPSKKVKITGFDIGEKGPNVQIDYNVKIGKPTYVDYSFSKLVDTSIVYYPKSEDVAWKITGYARPTVTPTKDTKSVDGKTRYVEWENTAGIEPFKYIGVNFNQDNLVTKIAFDLEDLSSGPNSLYYVPR